MNWEYIIAIIIDVLVIFMAVWVGYNWGFRKASKRMLTSPKKEEDKL